MSTNKNAFIRYQALDKCFRDRRYRYYIDDLIEKCEEAMIYYNGDGGVSRRQIFDDIKFMESEAGHYTLFITLAEHYIEKKIVRKRWAEWLAFEKELMDSAEVRGDRIH